RRELQGIRRLDDGNSGRGQLDSVAQQEIRRIARSRGSGALQGGDRNQGGNLARIHRGPELLRLWLRRVEETARGDRRIAQGLSRESAKERGQARRHAD